MLRFVFATLMLAILSALPSFSLAVENGTRAIVSDLSYWGVITRLEAAIKRRDLRIISRESVRGADRQKKLGIPGNMVIGAFGDEYTTRILRANVAAGIEAPIRFYVTRDPDEKTTTLWYRRPSWVLASYSDKSGELRAVGEELDRVMEAIAEEATEATKRTERLLSKREAGTPKPAPQKPAPVKDTVDTKAVKAVAKRTEPAKPTKPAKPKTDKVTAAATPKPEAANPPKRLVPKPLIPGKPETATAREAPRGPVARAAPKALGPARTATKTPQQGEKAPVETARRGAETPAEPKRLPPVAKYDPDRDAITLTPLMLKLQGQ